MKQSAYRFVHYLISWIEAISPIAQNAKRQRVHVFNEIATISGSASWPIGSRKGMPAN